MVWYDENICGTSSDMYLVLTFVSFFSQIRVQKKRVPFVGLLSKVAGE